VIAQPMMGTIAPIVMSCVVFAGSAQFAAFGVLTAGGSIVAAAVAGALTNLRFLVAGFAVAPSLKGGRIRRALEGQAVLDPSFALAAREDGSFDRGVLLWSTGVQYVSWIGGTVAGVALAGVQPDPTTYGLDVIMPAFFMTLLVGEVRTHRGVGAIAAVCSAAIAAVCTLVLAPGAPVAVAACASLIGLIRPKDT
jgi:predicted branched-subunit amino acid permease